MCRSKKAAMCEFYDEQGAFRAAIARFILVMKDLPATFL